MHSLFPEIQSYKQQWLDVDDRHSLYLEESGNPNGRPVLFVHGGPGGGTSPFNRRFFDPEKYRIILFDQRGCGRSKPHAELEGNRTELLINDIEAIRQHLDIDSWLLFGGSWGATLSLLYAQTHPKQVNGLILRGVFLCREQDIRWFYQQGANHIYPDFWEDYAAQIPAEEQQDFVGAYYRRLTSDNELARMAAAKAWSTWEARCSTLNPSNSLVTHFSDPHVALAMARIEAHYFVNNAFIEPNQILDHAARIQDIPTIIIHGRYDMVCPINQAYALYEKLPTAELHIVRDAGHSALEPGITDNLIKATNQFALRLA
ncbi:prolyl aminopeptidase [Motiliproteus coralliicola]|uniref:Proline iminopeptidase n=1 Tax=Motiliproteus coralliicola TaxID=2283196 RepID=A0A369WCB2_9GAMM|nr:prolyl aminopeptidase [Motiliproteus coralliicola]RDE18334.1 prolyl aminopeptidase [Motiliproteus coralliicola]